MKRPDVLLIAIDSLRADRLGCYGYHRNTSPNLDSLAHEGVLFKQAFAPGIPTTPSFTTLLTGLHPYRSGIVAHGADTLLDTKVQLLPQLFQRGGYTTVGIDNLVVQGNGRGSWFSRGFDYYSGFSYQPFGEQSTQLADRAIRFLRDFGNAENPLFLYLHLWAPHTPYSPPKPYDTLHFEPGSTPGLPSLEEIKAASREYYESFLGDMKLAKPDDMEWILAQYDGEISYDDSQVGRIVEELKVLGLDDDTLILITSDHGECFGEGGFWFDHHGLYDAVMKLSLIARPPKSWDARDIQSDEYLSNEDITPTLIDCCGLPAPEYSLTGTSFAPVLRGEKLASSREFLVGVESTRQASLCLRTRKWKLLLPIAHNATGEVLPDFYGRERDSTPVLFDLENDPAETRDVSAEYSSVTVELLHQLQKWRTDEVARRGGHDPILETGLGLPFSDFMARLTGRGLRG